MKFCPKCGKEVRELYENLCSKCFLERIRIEFPFKLEIKKCKFCGRFFVNEKWEEGFEFSVEELLKQLEKKLEIEVKSFWFENRGIRIILTKKFGKLVKKEKRFVNLDLKRSTCETCLFKRSGRVRGIIQVRGFGWEKIYEQIRNKVEKLARKDDKFFIVKEEVLGNGFNVYFPTIRVVRDVVKLVRREFKVKIKLSKKLVGIKRGKKDFIETYLILINEGRNSKS